MNYPMYDLNSGEIFSLSQEYLERLAKDVNENLNKEDVYLNDVYHFLGIPATEEGCRNGWPKDGTGFQELPYKSKPHWWGSNVIVID